MKHIIHHLTTFFLFMSVPALISARPICNADNISQNVSQLEYKKTKRPQEKQRLFHSEEVERQIEHVKELLTNEKMAWMFENCFPNTLDTTVHFRQGDDGNNDTFVYTGDIHAMWLRDSSAQVWPYVQFANIDPHLKDMIEGVIRRQIDCIILDPYANAFNDGPTGGEWMSDNTEMIPEVHERKYEIDSLCYPIRLAYEYWVVTGDNSIFDENWLKAINKIYAVFSTQQRKNGHGPYMFTRKTERAFDTLSNNGMGTPVKPCGLIASSFRPSDDATTFQFLIPSNFFAVSSLRKAAEILSKVNNETELSQKCITLANEVESAIKENAIYTHPEYGQIYAYEVDGFGNYLLMDDANVPSLLSLPYLGDVDISNPIYQNTRKFIWSERNPYFFKGKAGEGIGGPHIGYNMAWPMSIMMKAFTSTEDEEIKECLKILLTTDADTGFIHESFNVDNPFDYTRDWFAWQNTLFGELIIKLIKEGKLELLNSIPNSMERERISKITNPLPIEFGDPFLLCASDGKYYMYGTSLSDGFEAYVSKNLENWENIGQIYKGGASNQWNMDCFWAPEIYERDGKYYMFYSANSRNNPSNEEENFKIGVAVAVSPAGPFIDLYNRPIFEIDYPVIDANVLFDDSGKCYLYYSRCCYKHPVESEIADWARKENIYKEIEESWIYGVELQPDFSGIIGEPVKLLSPPQKIDDIQSEWESRSVTRKEAPRRWTEGSFIFKRGDKYYMMYSANAYFGGNYAVGYAVSDSPLGPFEKSKHNPVLSENISKGGNVMGTGHNMMLRMPDGNYYTVYHGRLTDNPDKRVVLIDKIVFDQEGNLEIEGPTTVPQTIVY